MKRFLNLRSLLPAAVAAAALVATPVIAAAGEPAPQANFGDHRSDLRINDRDGGRDGRDGRDRFDRRDDNYNNRYGRGGEWNRGRDHDHDHGGIDLDIRIGGGPRYEERRVQVWVPAVYRTECERVWVPEVCEDRVVRERHNGHWHTRVEHVVVTPGHFENRDRQVLVCEGHYETRVERVRVAERGGFGFRIGG